MSDDIMLKYASEGMCAASVYLRIVNTCAKKNIACVMRLDREYELIKQNNYSTPENLITALENVAAKLKAIDRGKPDNELLSKLLSAFLPINGGSEDVQVCRSMCQTLMADGQLTFRKACSHFRSADDGTNESKAPMAPPTEVPTINPTVAALSQG